MAPGARPMSRVRRRIARDRIPAGPTPEQRSKYAADRELMHRRVWAVGPGRGTPAAEAVTAATIRLRQNGWTDAAVVAELDRLDREHPGWKDRRS